MMLEKLSTFPDVKLFENASLVRFTTMRMQVSGNLIEISTIKALKEVISFLTLNQVRYHLVGLGANQVFINTKDIIFIKLCFDFDDEKLDLNHLYFPASITLNKLTKIAKKHFLEGWEVFTGIPASLGGAIAMNAGTRLGEIKDLVEEVDVLKKNGEVRNLKKEDLKFIYRGNSFLEEGDVIVGAKLSYSSINEEVVKKIDNYLDYRSKTQPLNTKNCGCIFKNPSPGLPAGKIIDELGLKGKEYKGLRISLIHGNFIENFDNAKASDFYDFVQEIKKIVKDKLGIEFEFEVKLI